MWWKRIINKLFKKEEKRRATGVFIKNTWGNEIH